MLLPPLGLSVHLGQQARADRPTATFEVVSSGMLSPVVGR